MAKGRAIAAILLLTLPMAAPAINSSAPELRWADEEPLRYRVRPGDTFARIAARGLNQPEDAAMLAGANGMAIDARLRAGQMISVPAMLLRREPLDAEVLEFDGDVRLGNGEPISVGWRLVEGDELVTGPNAHARLRMADGRKVMLPSQSRVRLAAMHRVTLTNQVAQLLTMDERPADWMTRFGLARAEAGQRGLVAAPLTIAASLNDEASQILVPVGSTLGRAVQGRAQAGNRVNARAASPAPADSRAADAQGENAATSANRPWGG